MGGPPPSAADAADRDTALLPRKVTLLVTETCNMRCRHCFSWTVRDRRVLSLEAVRATLHELRDWVGRFKLFLAGGEPTLRPDLPEIVAAGSGGDGLVSLASNGSLIDADLARRLVDAGLGHVDLSVESLDPDVHDRIRGRHGSHARVIAAARHLDTSRRRRRERDGGRLMSMNFLAVIQEGSYGGLPGLARFLTDEDLGWLLLQPVSPPFWSRYDSDWLRRSELWPRDVPAVHAVMDELIALKEAGARIDNSVEHLRGMKEYFTGGPAGGDGPLRAEALAGARGDRPDPFDPPEDRFEYLPFDRPRGREEGGEDSPGWGEGYLRRPGGRGLHRGALGPKRILSVLDVATAPPGVLPERIDRCQVGWRSANINHVGDVRLCHDMPPVGNINRASLRQIWRGERARLVRELIAHCHEGCYLLACNFCD
ncbi:radical SAM protein [Myxococcota bacterium]|nr:radical SAM protein [Myxococcota bacterium]